jgi:uncharacterized repeat protein (TIGR03837 family)
MSALPASSDSIRRWDIFCTVVDNFGDVGVCWRLARQLAAEHARDVRLWLDAPTALATLLPDYAPERAEQVMEGVRIAHWPTAASVFTPDAVADVVIEAFACTLPAAYRAALARRTRPPVWLNLEYLSAENWVAACHGLASPQADSGRVKHFFFPGFTPATGGLLRERDLFARRAAFAARQGRQAMLAELGLDLRPEEKLVSLFCYESAPVAALLAAWRRAGTPILGLVPPGQPQAAVRVALGDFDAAHASAGPLRLAAIPFLPQARFDALLWSSDLNFVRGEDSLVRAIWAARPFVWQLYPQAGGAHLDKLAAFLDPGAAGYGAGLTAAGYAALSRFWRAWNGDGDVAAAWPAFAAILPELHEASATFAARQARIDDLASQLVSFCRSQV